MTTKTTFKGQKGVSDGGGAQDLSKRVNLYFTLQLEHPDWSKTKCRNQAGYSRATKPDVIESSEAYYKLRLEYFSSDLDQRITKAQARAGSTIEERFKALQKIQKSTDKKDVLSAIKLETDITGDKRPERVDHNITGDESLLQSIFTK